MLCAQCNNPIPAARLAAIPEATLCRPCKELEDDAPVPLYRVQEALAEADAAELFHDMLGR